VILQAKTVSSSRSRLAPAMLDVSVHRGRLNGWPHCARTRPRLGRASEASRHADPRVFITWSAAISLVGWAIDSRVNATDFMEE